MGTGRASVDIRRRKASDALSALGSRRSDNRKLSLQCPRSHHVAAVYDTEAGLVYSTATGQHAHGSRDFVDTAHRGGRHGAEYVDLLNGGPMVDDELPAWCECGPRTLSRAELGGHIAAERRKVLLP